MAKLFVAVDLPATLIAELVAIQPLPIAGVRLVEPGQMHLTLHYIGEADTDRASRIADRLAEVEGRAFALTLEGVGQFPSVDGAITLWAGVLKNPRLLNLHAAVAKSLAKEGFRTEERPYTPHVSLARCSREVSAEAVSAFLTRHQGFHLPVVSLMQFTLFSSSLRGDKPIYDPQMTYPLSAVESCGK
jgi:RNA 2',3'-cyclic 3'-phosphodiesterase